MENVTQSSPISTISIDKKLNDAALKTYEVAQSNSLIKAMQASYTVDETRLLYYVLSFIGMHDKTLPKYKIPLTMLRSIFGENGSKSEFRSRVFKAFSALLGKQVQVMDIETRRFTLTSWISAVSFDHSFINISEFAADQKSEKSELKELVEKSTYVEIEISKELSKHLLGLQYKKEGDKKVYGGGFTKFKLSHILPLETARSVSMYRHASYLLGLKYSDKRRYTEDSILYFPDVSKMLDIDEKKSASAMKQALMRTISEINSKTNLLIEVKDVKNGKKTIAYQLTVSEVNFAERALQEEFQNLVFRKYEILGFSGIIAGVQDSVFDNHVEIDLEIELKDGKMTTKKFDVPVDEIMKLI